MKTIDNRKSYEWQNRPDSGSSDRSTRREQDRILKKFVSSHNFTKLDKFWWESLDRESKMSIYYSWRNLAYNYNHKNVIDFSPIFNDFIITMKNKYPGNIGKKRDMIINDILK